MRDHVIIVGASELVLPAYRIARHELGLGTIAFDLNPAAPAMAEADRAVTVSTKDVAGAVAAAQALAAELPVRGVFTCGADVEVTVAAIAEALALPGVPLAVAQACNDKVLMHQRLDALGFTAKPRYAVVTAPAQLPAALAAVGLPCVVKPIANCASRGVQRVESAAELAAAFALAAQFNLGAEPRVLIEQALEGSKHTVEMIAWQGERHLLSIIDTHYISPRWPCETGLNTTRLAPTQQQRAFAFACEVAAQMGIDFGAHKVDINLDAAGRPGLIELTARLSGGFHCQYASPLAFGSHDIRAALRLAVGQGLEHDDIRHRFERGSAVRAVFPPPGRITAIDGLAAARNSPGVAEVFVWCRPGERVGPYHNSADRPAFVIAAGADTDEAVANAERGVAALTISTEPEV